MPVEPEIVVLVRDLMFAGRIGAEARSAGVAVKMLRDPQKLVGLPGKLLIVDLNLQGAVDVAGTWKSAATGRSVVGFVAHTDAEAITSAREVGLDQILPRSRFVEVLPSLLRD